MLTVTFLLIFDMSSGVVVDGHIGIVDDIDVDVDGDIDIRSGADTSVD